MAYKATKAEIECLLANAVVHDDRIRAEMCHRALAGSKRAHATCSKIVYGLRHEAAMQAMAKAAQESAAATRQAAAATRQLSLALDDVPTEVS